MAGFVEYPDGPSDHEGIITYVENLVDAHKSWRYELDRGNQQKIFYYLGHHWITYDRGFQTWRPLGIRKTTPRPVTNKIQPLVNNTVSRLSLYRPTLSFRPGGLEPEDVVAAGVAEDVIRVVGKEVRLRQLRPMAARWLALTGNVFLVNGYDNTPDSGVQFVQHERCADCRGVFAPDKLEEAQGVCPTCGENQYEPAVDDMTGEPLGQYIPRGKHYTDVKSLFSVLYDPESQTIYDSPYFAVSETVPEDWAIQTFGKEATKDLEVEESSDVTQFFLQALAYATPSQGEGRIHSGGMRAARRIRLKQIWIKPRYDKAPRGIYCTILGNNRIVESQEWPYHDDQNQVFLNIVHMQFDGRPGSSVGRTRVDDLIPKQDERNLIESHFLLHTRRMSNAVWLVPTGTGITKFTGESGQVLGYNPTVGAPPPTRIAGVAPPQFLAEWMKTIDIEMDMIWGTYEIGRGEVPKRGGDLAFVSLQLLEEKAEQAQATVTENWSYGWRDWAEQHLHIWRQKADQERTLAISGGKWSLKKFNQAQLSGGVDIDVDESVFRPRSHITVRGTLEQLFRWGIINPQDPQERFRVLQILGMPQIMEDYRLDWTAANQENDEFVEGVAQLTPDMVMQLTQQHMLTQGMQAVGAPPEAGMALQGQAPIQLVPQPQPWENHLVHLYIHRQFLMTDDFREMPPPLQQMMFMHMMLHHMMATGGVAPGGTGKDSPASSDEQRTANRDTQQAAQGGNPERQTEQKGTL